MNYPATLGVLSVLLFTPLGECQAPPDIPGVDFNAVGETIKDFGTPDFTLRQVRMKYVPLLAKSEAVTASSTQEFKVAEEVAYFVTQLVVRNPKISDRYGDRFAPYVPAKEGWNLVFGDAKAVEYMVPSLQKAKAVKDKRESRYLVLQQLQLVDEKGAVRIPGSVDALVAVTASKDTGAMGDRFTLTMKFEGFVELEVTPIKPN